MRKIIYIISIVALFSLISCGEQAGETSKAEGAENSLNQEEEFKPGKYKMVNGLVYEDEKDQLPVQGIVADSDLQIYEAEEDDKWDYYDLFVGDIIELTGEETTLWQGETWEEDLVKIVVISLIEVNYSNNRSVPGKVYWLEKVALSKGYFEILEE